MQEEMILRAVGVVRSPIKEAIPVPEGENGISESYRERLRAYFKEVKETVSWVEIFPELEGILEGIEEFSHIFVIYWPHLLPRGQLTEFRVHPRGRKDVPKKGIFATLSPRRPNPILLSPVKLIEVRENRLRVQGLDAVDGSVVLDIKPYVPYYHMIAESVAPLWIEKKGGGRDMI
ncbi:MAG: tRNA (N6-threonylcarbamoyladenosine(37)-N6)-methyltransferase TrmO [Desulfatiglandales bacterium]